MNVTVQLLFKPHCVLEPGAGAEHLLVQSLVTAVTSQHAGHQWGSRPVGSLSLKEDEKHGKEGSAISFSDTSPGNPAAMLWSRKGTKWANWATLASRPLHPSCSPKLCIHLLKPSIKDVLWEQGLHFRPSKCNLQLVPAKDSTFWNIAIEQ